MPHSFPEEEEELELELEAEGDAEDAMEGREEEVEGLPRSETCSHDGRIGVMVEPEALDSAGARAVESSKSDSSESESSSSSSSLSVSESESSELSSSVKM